MDGTLLEDRQTSRRSQWYKEGVHGRDKRPRLTWVDGFVRWTEGTRFRVVFLLQLSVPQAPAGTRGRVCLGRSGPGMEVRPVWSLLLSLG